MVRILLVDDNAFIRNHLKTMLERQGDWVVVGEASDGRNALQQWKEHRPNLTVMDFVMPEVNGLEAGRKISQEHPESPVLMVTVDPSQELAHQAKKAGIKGLCAKADLRAIFSAVEALVHGNTYFHLATAA